MLTKLWKHTHQILYQQQQQQGGASAGAPLPAPAGAASANTVTQQQLLQTARLSVRALNALNALSLDIDGTAVSE